MKIVFAVGKHIEIECNMMKTMRVLFPFFDAFPKELYEVFFVFMGQNCECTFNEIMLIGKARGILNLSTLEASNFACYCGTGLKIFKEISDFMLCISDIRAC